MQIRLLQAQVPVHPHNHGLSRTPELAPILLAPRRQGPARQIRLRAQQQESTSRSSLQFPEQKDVQWAGDYKPGQVLGDKYEVLELLGRGGNAVTYKVKDTSTGRTLAVKALSLRSMSGWKQLDLFEREAKTLQGLSHPGIPAYVDYLETDLQQDKGFFLAQGEQVHIVASGSSDLHPTGRGQGMRDFGGLLPNHLQELAEGRSLGDLVRSGWRADETEVVRIGRELLQILQYLSSRRPPVVHRDIKPENIVLEGGKAGGQVRLVDFGGVQAAARSAEGTGSPGTTVIGTYGFMAPESFRGDAQPASDLYGLGATLLFLLSGKSPSSFPQARMRIDYSSSGLQLSENLDDLLEGLLEPLVEDRLSAEDALALLSEEPARRPLASVSDSGSTRQLLKQQPAGGRSKTKLRQGTLEVDIAPAGFTTDSAYTGAFAIAWNAFCLVWSASALAGGGVLFAAFSLPFWLAGFSLGRSAVGKSLIKEGLNIGPKTFELSQSLPLLGKKAGEWVVPKGIKGRSKDLIGAKIAGNSVINGALQTHIELHEGVRTHIFGEGLKAAEQQWLVRAINSHLTQQGCNVASDFSDKLPQGFNVVREQGFYDSGFRNNMLDDWADDD